jgi:transcriptional regulator with XRE-family HTH domain
MWRDRLLEIKKEKGITTKQWSEASGVSVDTINRVMNSKKVKTDAPRIDTIEDLCAGLGVELWEVFYLGDKSLVSLQAEINSLKAERDALVADNAVQKDKIEELRGKVDDLKDEIIAVHRHYIKRESKA